MIQPIDSIFYYECSDEMISHESIRRLYSLEVVYHSMASHLSTKFHIDFAPTDFVVDLEGSNHIKEFINLHLPSLVEISKDIAVKSPRYFVVLFCDGTEKHYTYNEYFCALFSIAKTFKPKEEPQKQPFDDELMAQIRADMLKQERTSTVVQRATCSTSQTQGRESKTWIIAVVGFLLVVCAICIFSRLLG